jgi:hypothetical protein
VRPNKRALFFNNYSQMKRINDDEYNPAKRVLRVLDCKDWPWTIVELILPWLPRAREVCTRWRECLRCSFQAKMLHEMHNCFAKARTESALSESAGGPWLIKGINYGLHLVESNACSYESIRKALEATGCDTAFSLPNLFPFLYGGKTFDYTNGYYQAYSISIGNPHYFLPHAVRLRLPEKLICESIECITKLSVWAPQFQLPFAMACTGISLRRVDAMKHTKPFEILTGLYEIVLDALYPAYLEQAEQRFPGFINCVAKNATSFRRWENVQWLLLQKLPDETRALLLQRTMKQKCEHDALFDRYIGTALQHISVSLEEVLNLYISSLAPECRHFLVKHFANDANLECHILKIASRRGPGNHLQEVRSILLNSPNLKNLIEKYLAEIFQLVAMDAMLVFALIKRIDLPSLAALDWKANCERLMGVAKKKEEIGLVKYIERLFVK